MSMKNLIRGQNHATPIFSKSFLYELSQSLKMA
jgi:hypothetical protein